MFDARIRPYIDPVLNALGRSVAKFGISANMVTLSAIVPALAAGFAIAQHHYLTALVLILFNRVIDGLDGAVARFRGITDFGGYLDTLADYVFYISVPAGFGFANSHNAQFAMLLIASFTLTCASFLVFAAIAARRGQETAAHGQKSFFYSTGLAEGAETILAFTLMCLLPQHFSLIATVFAALCLLTVLQRSVLAKSQFS